MIVRITDWLFQGDADSVRQGEYKRHPVRAVACVSENRERAFPEESLNPGVSYLWCPFDDPGEYLTAQKLSAIIEFARVFRAGLPAEQAGGLLVHCAGGINRSSAVCALLLATLDGLPAKAACALVAERNDRMYVRPELTERIFALTGHDIRAP